MHSDKTSWPTQRVEISQNYFLMKICKQLVDAERGRVSLPSEWTKTDVAGFIHICIFILLYTICTSKYVFIDVYAYTYTYLYKQ